MEEADRTLTTAYNYRTGPHGGPPGWVIPRDVMGIGPVVEVQWEAIAVAEPDDAPPAPETVRIR
jgi:hypothetical protein